MHIETKIMFNLTKRQLICFTLGILAGFPIFWLLKGVDSSIAILAMMLVASPFFITGIYKKHNQPIELLVKQIFRKSLKPSVRTYKSENYYLQLEKQYKFKSEVEKIISRG